MVSTCCVLQPDVFASQIFVNVQSKNTKKYKDAVKQYGRVFTLKEKHDAERLADALLRNEMVLQKLNDSEFEQSEVFTYRIIMVTNILLEQEQIY